MDRIPFPQRGEIAAPRAADEPPAVDIHIGRLEIRAPAPPAPAPRPRPSLDAFLAGGRR